ncbi:MAG: TraR/DksA C4-type zinc finger protein [Candidatus Omnitrophota bacterium]|nr:TraR/DksA C4-type zinc finger protein [Candidatus Omnitrophota bacterium]
MKKKNKMIKKKAVKRMKVKAKNAVKKAEKTFKIKKMSSKDLKKYKELLLKEREKIGSGINHIAQDTLKTSQRDASGDLSGYSFHMADMASDNYEVEFSLGRASDEQDVLYSIDEALKRVADGTYGNCPQCGKQIPKRRLDAIPHTELCIACQSKNESK